MLISTGNLTPDTLAGQVAIVTGAGRGIGYEAARALSWLGAAVIIAEIDGFAGKEAERKINAEFENLRVRFIQVNVGDQRSVATLAKKVLKSYGQVDILIHNATIAPLGAVKDVPIQKWDQSYAVNLRGPVLLTQAFLPGMLNRDYGVLMSVSSTGLAYMGGYEIYKTAQVELANTLDAELEGTGVIAFTIGPGMAPTKTALSSIERLAPMMGQSVETFHEIIKDQTISVEAAGAGFAAAAALAQHFRGQEIASMQALTAAGIKWQEDVISNVEMTLSPDELAQALESLHNVKTTYVEQSSDWKNRHLFERQWLYRTFKKHTGMTVDQVQDHLEDLQQKLEEGNLQGFTSIVDPIEGLRSFYSYLADMAKGCSKDQEQLEEHIRIVNTWVDETQSLIAMLMGDSEVEKTRQL
jgi:NAD(P)-dependent dehydrogenase (short-subunit alcohol dehydrogenase family)